MGTPSRLHFGGVQPLERPPLNNGPYALGHPRSHLPTRPLRSPLLTALSSVRTRTHEGSSHRHLLPLSSLRSPSPRPTFLRKSTSNSETPQTPETSSSSPFRICSPKSLLFHVVLFLRSSSSEDLRFLVLFLLPSLPGTDLRRPPVLVPFPSLKGELPVGTLRTHSLPHSHPGPRPLPPRTSLQNPVPPLARSSGTEGPASRHRDHV